MAGEFPIKPFRLTGYYEKDFGQIDKFLSVLEWTYARFQRDHSKLKNLPRGDPHTQYAAVAQTETISGSWFHAAELVMSGAPLTDAAFADLASASEMSIPETGNAFNVTGGTTITLLGGVTAGRRVLLRFASDTILYHHATDLILLSGVKTHWHLPYRMFSCGTS